MNPTTITLTDSAAQKISELIAEEDNPKLNLRISISGGGCSGFEYGFVFDESINADDICVLKKVKKTKPKAQGNEEEEDEGEGSAGSVDVGLQANNEIAVSKKTKRTKLSKNNKNKAEEEDEGGEGEGSMEVRLVVDAMSFQYLMGAEVDYKLDVKGEQFIIRNNPMAKTTCGCGSSFSA